MVRYAHELLSAEPSEMAKLVYDDITTWISARKTSTKAVESSQAPSTAAVSPASRS